MAQNLEKSVNGADHSESVQALYMFKYAPVAAEFIKEGDFNSARGALENLAADMNLSKYASPFIQATLSNEKATATAAQIYLTSWNAALESSKVQDIYNYFLSTEDLRQKKFGENDRRALQTVLDLYKNDTISSLRKKLANANERFKKYAEGSAEIPGNIARESDENRLLLSNALNRVNAMLEYNKICLKQAAQQKATENYADIFRNNIFGLSN